MMCRSRLRREELLSSGLSSSRGFPPMALSRTRLKFFSSLSRCFSIMEIVSCNTERSKCAKMVEFHILGGW